MIPTDELIFFRGVRIPPSSLSMEVSMGKSSVMEVHNGNTF